MKSCEHIFELDKQEGQVRCKICGDLDDEMQLANSTEKELADEFYKTQESFE